MHSLCTHVESNQRVSNANLGLPKHRKLHSCLPLADIGRSYGVSHSTISRL